jgi:hypothetical protein
VITCQVAPAMHLEDVLIERYGRPVHTMTSN